YQRVAAGTPMSALFLADGRRSRLLGVNRQIVRRLGARPYAFHGCIGPLPVAPGVKRKLQEALDALTAHFGLRGLNGLDFLLDDERFAVLELNPRPPASMTLYRAALPGGLLRAHLTASLDGRLPAEKSSWPVTNAAGITAKTATSKVSGAAATSNASNASSSTDAQAADGAPPDRHGFEVLFARRACRVSAATAATLATHAWCHDLPAGDTQLGAGEPLCTVSASARTTAAVRAQLDHRRQEISTLLEQIDEVSSGVCGDRTFECQ
ncbi:MAG TPA: ATP-grasp domain-containing protein, partial [Rhodocyclaceae bacterium]|nr:ATP-grasp domain-containing protein [Rhodocyclaceae bacterium]